MMMMMMMAVNAGACSILSAVVLLFAKPSKYLEDLKLKRESSEYKTLLASSDFKDLVDRC
jgi:hypothetical protein